MLKNGNVKSESLMRFFEKNEKYYLYEIINFHLFNSIFHIFHSIYF